MRSQHRGEGQANGAREVFGPWLRALTLTAPFSLRLDLVDLKVSAFVIAISQERHQPR